MMMPASRALLVACRPALLLPLALAACPGASGGTAQVAVDPSAAVQAVPGAGAPEVQASVTAAVPVVAPAALTPAANTPEAQAPPPLHAVVMPNIPALPPPPQPSHGSRPMPVRLDMVACGEVWTGAAYEPRVCFDPDARVGHPMSAKVVVPYEKMRQPPYALPRVVNHRVGGSEGPIRDQRAMPSCTAMALTAAFDHASARWTGQASAFSVMEVWGRYHDSGEQLQTVPSHHREEGTAADYNVGALLGAETDWPYDAKEARTTIKCGPKTPPGVVCGQAPSAAKIAALNARPLGRVTQIEVIGASQFDILREKIAGGQDATFAFKVPTAIAVVGDPGSKHWGLGPKSVNWDGKFRGSHQVLIAGYAMTPTGTFYLVHNSMGASFGDQGYAWLLEDYLNAFTSDNVMVIPDVEPVQIERNRFDEQGQLHSICPAGQVRDSISGACAPFCPDGSPRHGNVCANPQSGECPAGMVNLTGECMATAPHASGVEGGVQWACGPGGCTYAFPRGQFGCTQTACNVSCPSPAFRLATVPGSLVCVE